MRITRFQFCLALGSALLTAPAWGAPADSLPPAIELKLPRLDGRIATDPDQAESKAAQAAARMGESGVWVIRDKARWDQLRASLREFGWKFDVLSAKENYRPAKPGAAPPLDPESIDFAHTMLVGVFRYADLGQEFSIRKHRFGNGSGELDLLMSYVMFKSHVPSPKFQFMLLAVPRTSRLKVSVSTYHPHNGGKHETPETAALEWQGEFAEDSGDVIQGLTGVISTQNAKIRPGEDIRVLFELRFRPAALAKEGQFAPQAPAATVWDGKYSEGYRNHAFLVTTPDGKTQFLRPKVQDQWEKNVPHPVQVTEAAPYKLPNWFEGSFAKSLKELGLETTQPGSYVITGVYLQQGGKSEMNRIRQDKAPMWGGNLATNTIVVEVK